MRNDYSLEAVTNTGVLAPFGMYGQERQLENLVALMSATARKGNTMDMVNLIPRRNIPVVARAEGGAVPLPHSRLQRDIKALLRQ